MSSVCLINPPTTRPSIRETYFPMALVCLGTVLKEQGIATEIVDFDLSLKNGSPDIAWHDFRDTALNRLKKTKSRLFGISSICSNFPISILLARAIKQAIPDAHVILGGPQPSAVPEETLKAFPWIDAIVIGEGEHTLLELSQAAWNKASLSQVVGIAFRYGDKIIRTPRRPLINDLDSLPIPDFSLIPLRDYLTLAYDAPLIEAGRGCPFLCSFCSTALMWERKFRVKSPARVQKEMRVLNNEYGLKSFALTHDNFTTSHSFVAEFSEYFQKNNIEGFPWSVSARPDTINAERVQALAGAGCSGLFFGVDSGSPKIQQVMQKNLNLEHTMTMLDDAITHDMEVTSSFIVGFPEEDEDDINQTILMGLASKMRGAHYVQYHPLAPLASTRVYNDSSNDIHWNPDQADLAFHPIRCDEVNDLIAGSSQLFSFFYAVKTPLHEVPVTAFCVFYDALVNRLSAALEQVLKSTGLSPTELFHDWLAWKNHEHPTEVIDGDFIYESFPYFIRSWLGSREATIKTANAH